MLFIIYVTSQSVRTYSTAFQIIIIAVLHKTFNNQLSVIVIHYAAVMLNMIHPLRTLHIHDTLEVSSAPVFRWSVVTILTALLLHSYYNISGNDRY